MTNSEADTCRKFVVPRLQASGWDNDPHSIAEQRRIVARIERLAAKVHEAKQLRVQAVDHVAALASSGHHHWLSQVDEVRMGDVCEVIDPNPSHRYPAYVPKDVPMITTSDFVRDDGIDTSHCRHVPRSFFDATLGRYAIGAGDVIFARKGKIGYARPYPQDAILAMTHTLCVLKPDRARLHPRYLLHFARSNRFLRYLTGTMNPNVGVPTLGLNVIRDASLPLPSLRMQEALAEQMDAFRATTDLLKSLQAETVHELDAMLPAILDQAFKGEL